MRTDSEMKECETVGVWPPPACAEVGHGTVSTSTTAGQPAARRADEWAPLLQVEEQRLTESETSGCLAPSRHCVFCKSFAPRPGIARHALQVKQPTDLAELKAALFTSMGCNPGPGGKDLQKTSPSSSVAATSCTLKCRVVGS